MMKSTSFSYHVVLGKSRLLLPSTQMCVSIDTHYVPGEHLEIEKLNENQNENGNRARQQNRPWKRTCNA